MDADVCTVDVSENCNIYYGTVVDIVHVHGFHIYSNPVS